MPGETLLLIDDDPTLVSLLSEFLQKAGYTMLTAQSGAAGLKAFYESHPRLVVLDVMMPRMDGWIVCERLREVSDVPIILLTAKGEERDRLRGFRLGVDDYVVKPFSFSELAARVGAILGRRVQPEPAEGAPLVRGEVVIDLPARRVTRAGKPIHLTPKEFRLLEALAEQPGRTVSPQALLERVWGPQYDEEVDNVKRYVHYLRRKIEDDPDHPTLILTERGFGYFLAP